MQANKVWFIIAIILIITLAIGGIMVFGKGSGDAAVYFPLKAGNTWTYKMNIGDKHTQLKFKVAEPENGNLKVIMYNSQNDPQMFFYYQETAEGLLKTKEMNANGVMEYKPSMLALSANMKVGSSWSWESSDHQMKERSKVIAAEKVTVPAGTFNTVVVQSDGEIGGIKYTVKTWYAKDIGYVKDELKQDQETRLSVLTEYKVN